MKRIGMLLVFIGAFCYGIQSSLVKMAYAKGITMWEILLMEYFLAAILFWGYTFIFKRKELKKLTWKNSSKLLLLGILGPGLTSIFYYISLLHLPASLSVVMLFQYLLFVILFEKVINRSSISVIQWVSVLFIMIGTAFAVNVFAIDFHDLSLVGIIAGIFAAFTYAIYLFFTDKVASISSPTIRSTMIATSIPLFAVVIKNPVDVFTGGGADLQTLILWGVIITVVGQMIPLITFNVGVPLIGSQASSIIGAFELPAATICSAVLLHEQIVSIQWVGIALIMVAIVLSEVKNIGGEWLSPSLSKQNKQ